MNKNRLEAFSDGVLAIVITIMVLEMKSPHGAAWADLAKVWPIFLSYVISFFYVGICWNSHHHIFHAVQKVSAKVMWVNLLLLFWLSLLPFAAGWMGENHFAAAPTMFYGFILLMMGGTFALLQRAIIATDGPDSPMATAVGQFDRKPLVAVLVYVVGIALAVIEPIVSQFLYVAVAIMYAVPDKRIERVLQNEQDRL